MKTIGKNIATTPTAGHTHTAVPACYARAAKLVKGFKPLQVSPSPSAESKSLHTVTRVPTLPAVCLPTPIPSPCSCVVCDPHVAAILWRQAGLQSNICWRHPWSQRTYAY